MFKKKLNALSPLIATILLVAVSLSLAGILYSWASQNAKDTVTNVTESQAVWEKCQHVYLDIEQGCKYDSTGGISFILYDKSTTELDSNLVLTVIDSENEIKTVDLEPKFIGGAMSVKSTEVNGLTKPLMLVKIHYQECNQKVAQTRSCN